MNELVNSNRFLRVSKYKRNASVLDSQPAFAFGK